MRTQLSSVEIACILHSSVKLVKTNSLGFYRVRITTTAKLDMWSLQPQIFHKLNNYYYYHYNVASFIDGSWGYIYTRVVAVRDCSSRLRWMWRTVGPLNLQLIPAGFYLTWDHLLHLWLEPLIWALSNDIWFMIPSNMNL